MYWLKRNPQYNKQIKLIHIVPEYFLSKELTTKELQEWDVTSLALIPTDVLLNIVLFGLYNPQGCPWSRLTVLLGLALNGITDPKARLLYVEPWTFKSIEFYTWVPLGYHGLMVLMYRNVTLVTWLSPHIDRWLQLTNIDFFFFFKWLFGLDY